MNSSTQTQGEKRRPRLVFVDDEPLVLRSLRRLLSSSRPEWDLVFVESGDEALAELAQSPVDVLVSDMQMDAMDGATLLEHVQKHHPQIVRIILTGYAEPRLVNRSIRVAHQFLRKGIDPVQLRHTLDQACRVRDLLDDDAMRKLVGGSNDLPAAPKTFTALQKALRDPKTSARDIGAIVERDIALSARLMHLASSAFFGLPRHVTTVGGAVAYLGVATIQTLVLAVEVFSMFSKKNAVPGVDFDELQRHALQTGRLAHGMMSDKDDADDALLAGVLHDVGLLILADRMPEQLQAALALGADRGMPLFEAEAEVYGVTHAALGAYLLGLWGLRPKVIDGVRYHHQRPSDRSNQLDVAAAVYFANHIMHESAEGSSHPPPPDEELHPFDADGRLERWRARAAELRGHEQ